MYSQLCECVDLIKREAIDWIFDKELLIEDSDDIDIMAIFSPYLKNKERTKEKSQARKEQSRKSDDPELLFFFYTSKVFFLYICLIT